MASVLGKEEVEGSHGLTVSMTAPHFQPQSVDHLFLEALVLEGRGPGHSTQDDGGVPYVGICFPNRPKAKTAWNQQVLEEPLCFPKGSR